MGTVQVSRAKKAFWFVFCLEEQRVLEVLRVKTCVAEFHAGYLGRNGKF